MAWLRDWSWRIAILALPWQTRWFQEGPMAGGLPWEQGRPSFFLVWIPMIITIFIACADFKQHPDERDEIQVTDWMLFAGILLLGLPAFVSIHAQASWQWLTQIILLVFFGWSLQQLKAKPREVMAWAVGSLVPHAVLGLWQFVSQSVVGSKWLGISAQNPLTLGVSIVEAAGQRVLRAYGGFPHPNIFGGWLAFGLVATLYLAKDTVKRYERILLCITASLFSVVLVFTFSRSAWIAAVLGISATFFVLWRQSKTAVEKWRFGFLTILIVASASLVAFSIRDLIFIRALPTTRLETKSVDERQSAIANAWSLVREERLLGQGQNTAILALDRAGKGIVPPHFIPLLVLLETGWIGVLGVVLLMARWLMKARGASFVPLMTAVPLVLLDHYLWSIWAGQALLLWLALFPLTDEQK